jgi:hypothetical protein
VTPDQRNGNGFGRDGHAAAQAERVLSAFNLATQRYKPKPFAGKVVLLVNEQSHRTAPALGWADFVPKGLKIYKLPGNHDSCVPDNIPLVAKILKECFEATEQNDPG